MATTITELKKVLTVNDASVSDITEVDFPENPEYLTWDEFIEILEARDITENDLVDPSVIINIGNYYSVFQVDDKTTGELVWSFEETPDVDEDE